MKLQLVSRFAHQIISGDFQFFTPNFMDYNQKFTILKPI
jgi:hypothetical protein